jgi:hypothetical protein
MKNVISILLPFILFLSSCEEGNQQSYLPGNSGNQGELLIVAPASFWNDSDADFLRQAMLMLYPSLPASEPFFTSVEVKLEGFNDLFKTHRNILEFRVDHTNETSISIKRNVYAKQQLLVIVTLNKIGDLKSLMANQFEQILFEFHKAELSRLQSRNRAFGKAELNTLVKEKTGLEITLQQDFEIAKESPNFLWLRCDRQKPVGGYQHQINQGILIYSRPYTDTADFSEESIAAWKNDVNKSNIDGPGTSYMSISYRLYPPEFKTITFHDQAAQEIRGLWRMEGGKGVFMGGPFYGLVFYNPENGLQYIVEGYVYGPQFNKRAFMREVEAIVSSVSPVL